MCGITGVLYADADRSPDGAILRAMGDAIAHRGPDAHGFWSAAGIGLVHRRLSIIDLASGDQPLGNEDGSIQVVFNGEIYNYLTLRTELLAQGHQFRTRSDTEVLVHLYEELGEEMVSRLRGMFAFAIWDARRRKLLLARDRVGLKPLYLYRDHEKLLFGSEIKAILAHPEVRREIDLEALEEYLALGMTTGERSIFRNIRKLPPAHVWTIEPGRWVGSPRRYWSLRVEPELHRSVDEWHEVIAAKVQETVAAHQIADVPVGAFLSGGLDSSVMVALQSQLGSSPVKTFSIGFREAQFSELPFARQVAEQFRTEHFEELLMPEAAAALDDLVRYYDEPFADSSAIPTLAVSRLASRHVKVVISGDGGDEAFGGYSRYAHDLREANWRERLPGWFRRKLLGPLSAVWPKADWLPRPLRAKTLLTNLSLDAADAYANTLTMCRLPLRRQLLSADVVSALNGHRPGNAIRNCFAAARPNDPLAGMILADANVLLPDDFLVKVDRASMAYGLEVRPPLVDHELLELAASVPSEYKVRDGQTKWLFKQIYRERLPSGFTTRPKQGFEIPVDGWLRGPLRDVFEATVLAGGAWVSDYLDQPTVKRLYSRHVAGVGRHGNVLWGVLVLAKWGERWAKN